MKRTLSRISTALQVFALVATSVALLAVVTLVATPRIMGWQPVVVRSGSMEPALPVGSLVFLDPVHPDQVKVGDVISYRIGNARVTHRVVEIGKDAQGTPGFKTKGDANAEPDPGMVSAASVDSREVWSVPYVGKISNFIRSRDGFYIIIALPASVIVASSLVSIVVELNRQRRKAAA